MNTVKGILLGVLLCLSAAAMANTVTVKMYQVAQQGHGKFVGTITAEDTEYGLLLEPNLHGLPPGLHGFHVHQNPNCDNFGKAAGGHYDPQHTDKHLGPYNKHGHKGDLPALCINKKGQDDNPVLAPRLLVSDLKGHALMIHIGGDNYSDTPKKLGGGGARIICGIVK